MFQNASVKTKMVVILILISAVPLLISIGVNISHDMFAVVHLQAARWHDFKNTFHHDAPKLQGKVKIIDDDQTQRVMFNRLCIRQSHEAVFGRSPNVKDYI